MLYSLKEATVIEKIKRDRLIQVMLVLCALVIVFIVVIAAATLYRFNQPAQTVAPTVGPSPTPIVLKFEGTGDKVVFFDAPATGAGLIGFGHSGDANFIVNLMKDDGTFIDQPANAIGEYKGEKTLVIDKGGYMLEVQADGDWFIVILPPQ